MVSQMVPRRTPWEIHWLNPGVVLITLKPSQGENWVFWEWLNSPCNTKQAPNHFAARAIDTGGGRDQDPVLGWAELGLWKANLCLPHASHHPCLTLSAPPLLSFAVSQDLFSPIFLPAGPLHFPAPAGLGWLAHAVMDPSW